MKFDIDGRDIGSSARCGRIHTDHGIINTPIFMPVGTQGTVKGVQFRDLETQINADIILGNTYHLYLRPGTQLLQKAGGLHRFNSWSKPILTDSGGYQVYSLAARRKITENGVTFSSHIDGSRHVFTPESVMDVQAAIGGDIIMAFDECTPYPCDQSYAKTSMELTHRWLDRCIDRFKDSAPLYNYVQTLFPIVQGSVFPDLRKRSAEFIASKQMPGNAIGGLSVGEPNEEMYRITELVCGILPNEKPRYLMGVGTPADLLESIALGIDMFDCVMPTRNARNGMLFTWEGIINIRNRKWADDLENLPGVENDELSSRTSKAFLRHMFMSKEMLGPQIASVYNLTFYLQLVRQAGEQIKAGTFANWKDRMIPKLMQRL